MTFYSTLGFSSCELAGAVAEAAIHDLRVNLFSFPGFPQILVAGDAKRSNFTVTLSWGQYENCEVQIEITATEAKTAVRKFKAKTGFDRAIFERIQIALAALEGKSSDAFRRGTLG